MTSSSEASLSISTQETPLLQKDQNQPRIKNFKAKISFVLRIVIVLIAGFIIIYSIYTKNSNPKPPHNKYLSGLSKYYCHLTRHRKLCYDSVPSIITNFTQLEFNPAPIFTAPLQLFFNELNHTAISISEALSSPSSNTSLIGPKLYACQTLVNDSLSQLHRSLTLLRVDKFFGSWIPYVEDLKISGEIEAVKKNIGKCLLGLGEIDRKVDGMEEVRMGVAKASRHAVNFISLFDRRNSVLDDFYNPYYIENEGYNYLYNYYFLFDYYGHRFDYYFLVCLFGAMYLFIGLLYFLFWQQ